MQALFDQLKSGQRKAPGFVMLGAGGRPELFPSWIGVYGDMHRHNGRNPGTFIVMMNQDYFGLQCEIAIQVGDEAWKTYRMEYKGNIEGNSVWQFAPEAEFPQGATVRYFFRGYDWWGGQVWDSCLDLNYSFTVAAASQRIRRLNAAHWRTHAGADGEVNRHDFHFWVDFAVCNIGTPESIGVMWTDDDWNSWHTSAAKRKADLPNGDQQWTADVLQCCRAEFDRERGALRWRDAMGFERKINGAYAIQYAVFYQVRGTWHWDNNQGQDFSIMIPGC
jgi:hypothetical protein